LLATVLAVTIATGAATAGPAHAATPSDRPTAAALAGTTTPATATTSVSAHATTNATQSDYRVTLEDAVAVPPRTVTLEGTDYRIAEVGRVPRGADALPVTVASPPDDIYRVYLYDADRRIVASARGEGPTRATLSVEGLSAGTYLLAIQHRGVTQRVRPVVVAGYDLRAAAPRDATVGQPVRVVATATPALASDRGHTAAVVLGTDATTRRANATLRDGRLVATVDTAGVRAGEYRAYAVVQGDRTDRGRREVLALAGAGTVTLTAATGTPPEEPATPARAPAASNATPTSGPPSPTPTPTPTRTAGVITPAPSTASPTPDSRRWLDGFDAPLGIAAVIVLATIALGRRHRAS
jgi:hypothetical protein